MRKIVMLLAVVLCGCVDAPPDEVEVAEAPPQTLRIRLSVYNSAPERVDGCAANLGLIRGYNNWHDAYPVYPVECDVDAAIYEVPRAATNFWFLDELPKVIGPEFELFPIEVKGTLRVSVRLPQGWEPTVPGSDVP